MSLRLGVERFDSSKIHSVLLVELWCQSFPDRAIDHSDPKPEAVADTLSHEACDTGSETGSEMTSLLSKFVFDSPLWGKARSGKSNALNDAVCEGVTREKFVGTSPGTGAGIDNVLGGAD